MPRTVYLAFGLSALILASCGGNNNNNDTPIVPTPTPEPTLTFEERSEYDAGLAQNPLRMIIKPVDTVPERISMILEEELGMQRAGMQTDFADVLEVEEGFNLLNRALERDFGVQVGSEEQFDTVGDLSRYVQQQLGKQVSAAIFDRTGLYVDVVLVDDYGNALEGLCASGSGLVTIPWLDGVTYVGATAQSCGQPALQVAVADGIDDFLEEASVVEETDVTPEVEVTAEAIDLSDRELRVGEEGLLVAAGQIGASEVTDQVFCRLGVDDFYSWLLPTLVMEQNSIDPMRAPASINDYSSMDEIVDALVNAECAMTGMERQVYDSLDDEQQDQLSIVEESVAFPYGVLMYPLEVQLGVRLSLNEHLSALAEDLEDGRTLRMLLGQATVLPAVRDDFAAVEAFMEATGYDLAVLGD